MEATCILTLGARAPERGAKQAALSFSLNWPEDLLGGAIIPQLPVQIITASKDHNPSCLAKILLMNSFDSF